MATGRLFYLPPVQSWTKEFSFLIWLVKRSDGFIRRDLRNPLGRLWEYVSPFRDTWPVYSARQKSKNRCFCFVSCGGLAGVKYVRVEELGAGRFVLESSNLMTASSLQFIYSCYSPLKQTQTCAGWMDERHRIVFFFFFHYFFNIFLVSFLFCLMRTHTHTHTMAVRGNWECVLGQNKGIVALT